METIIFTPHGVCSRQISITIDNDVIVDARFTGGCSGNTQGLCALVRGMKVDDAIERLEGIKCGPRPTSCPDQFARALKEYKSQKN